MYPANSSMAAIWLTSIKHKNTFMDKVSYYSVVSESKETNPSKYLPPDLGGFIVPSHKKFNLTKIVLI